MKEHQINQSNPIQWTIEPETVHLWHASALIDAMVESDYCVMLSDDELEKASTFRFQKDRKLYVTAHALLRLLSAKYLSRSPKSIVFKHSQFGKPDYVQDTTLGFNISHAHQNVLIGFTHNKTIGVDIEFIKRDFDVMEIAANFFSKTEINALQKIPKNLRERAFYRCWTRKEAFIKAEGSGLSFALDQFTVTLDHDTSAELLETKWDHNEKEKWSLHSLSPEKDYLAAVAVRGAINTYILREWQH